MHLKVDKKDHWGLAVVNFAQRRIGYFDSLVMAENYELIYGSKVRSGLTNLQKFLEEEHLKRFKTPFCRKMQVVVQWPLLQQWNNADCGVFALFYAWKLAANDFDMCNSEGRLPNFRQEIRRSIMRSSR